MAHFKLDLEIYTDGLENIDELKELLGEFCGENDLEMEGSVVKLGKRAELDRDYVVV